MNPIRIAVAGGGISGLVAGYTLQQEASRRSVPIELSVLEGDVQAGGHARSVTDDGWVVERGPNGFLDRGEETMALVDELQLRSSLVEANPASRRRFILQGGRLCQVPESPPSLITTDALGWRGKLRLLREPWAAAPPADTDETVFEFAVRRHGSRRHFRGRQPRAVGALAVSGPQGVGSCPRQPAEGYVGAAQDRRRASQVDEPSAWDGRPDWGAHRTTERRSAPAVACCSNREA